MRYRTLSGTLACAVALALCSSSTPAFAQSDEQRAGARSLATEGATAFNEGRYKEAAEFFTKAESLVHAPPHLLFIARAHAKLGQLVKAREAYIKITREQLPGNAPQAFRDAQSSANRELAAINPKIGSLTIKVEGAENAKDLSLRIDDVQLPGVLAGAAQPVDPGEHKIEALATGFRSRPQSVRVGDGEKTSVALKLEADAKATPPGGGATTAAATADTSRSLSADTSSGSAGASPPPSADTGADSKAGMRIGSYVAFGVGAVGLGLGTVFMLKASGKRTDADDLCNPGPTGQCSDQTKADQIHQLDSEADSATTVGIIGLVAGGVAVGGGVVLLVLSSGSGSDSKGASIHPWVGPNSAGFAGRF
ncbi:MAG TPA: hypothetical protein VF881_11400 [Polyangiaceae bacterium]